MCVIIYTHIYLCTLYYINHSHMSDTNKPEEVVAINQSVKPEAVVVEEDLTVEPSSSVAPEEAPAELSDDDILDQLHQNVQKEQPKESRKTKAIKKSLDNFNEVIGEGDTIDFGLLIQKLDKNPKGLATFAEANNYDLAELEQAIEAERDFIYIGSTFSLE